MPVLICLRKNSERGLILQSRDQVPVCPVFTLVKNKVPFWDSSEFAVTVSKNATKTMGGFYCSITRVQSKKIHLKNWKKYKTITRRKVSENVTKTMACFICFIKRLQSKKFHLKQLEKSIKLLQEAKSAKMLPKLWLVPSQYDKVFGASLKEMGKS